MTTKRLYTAIFSIIVTLLAILMTTSTVMYRNYRDIVSSNEIRAKSLRIASELRVSTDNLSSYSRTYVATGDTLWKNRYFNVLGVRSGLRPWHNGSIISFRDSILKLGFNQEEVDYLDLAQSRSDLLAETEIVAFNILEGKYPDEDGNFTIKGEPNKQLANQMLYDSTYLQKKNEILKPINSCILIVNARTMTTVEAKSDQYRQMLLVNIALILILVVVSFIFYFVIANKQAEQIVELKAAKDQAERSELRFRHLFEKSPDIITITTLDGRFIESNPAHLKFHGLSSAEELKNTNITELYANPFDRTDLLEDLWNNGFVYNKEIEYKSLHDGSIINALFSCEIIETESQGVQILAWLRDITQKAKKDKAIREMSTAMEQSPAVIVITDLQGNIEYTNKQFTEITGYSHDEALGNNPKVLNSGTHPKEYFKEMWDTILSGEVWEGELYNRRKDGTYFWEEARIAPVFNDRKELVNFVAIKQDITLRKKTQDDLIENEKKLLELNRTKDRLFSIIGHDLRSPLGGVIGMLEFLVKDESIVQSEQLYPLAKLTLSSATEIYNLLENLLQWAKGQQKEMIFHPVELDLHEISSISISLLAKMAELKAITIHNNIPSGFTVNADKEMLMTVIRNLLSNAIKFTEQSKNIYVSVESDKDGSVFEVKDEGLGMEPEIQKQLFSENFSKTTRGTAGETGTGLGLMLCKTFIEAHNGKIWVESNLGEGSSFKFFLPKKNGII